MFMSELRIDQAAGLRRMAQPHPVRVIAVTSGKGGVGKTNVSVNLSVALSETGKNVMLLDADLGLANVDVLLGLQPKSNLSHVIDGHRTLEEVIVEGPSGIMVVPAASGVKRLAELGTMENAGLIRAFSELNHAVDTLIIDTAAGINESVTSFSRAAQEVVVETTSGVGTDLIDVILDPAVEGQSLILEFHAAAELDVQLLFLVDKGKDTRLRAAFATEDVAERFAERTPDGHLRYVIPAIHTAASNRLGLIVTRFGDEELLDSAGEYTLLLRSSIDSLAQAVGDLPLSSIYGLERG